MSAPVTSGVLVACVGNVLRGDDGFGPAVAAQLDGQLPARARLIETGIGGIALVQELLAGYEGLVIVDAVDDGTEPGTVLALEPEIDGVDAHVPDVHLANPRRVLAMAAGLGVLPGRVTIVGCQPSDADELGERLSPEVERAVPVATAKVIEIVETWLGANEGNGK
jgi:hydrogenase maturation protease